MRLLCYVKGDTRIHVDRDDDGSMIRAQMLTNPPKGFRKKLCDISSEEALNRYLAMGYVKTFDKEL